jgi:SPP1 family predicted phage head-tail adaptor
MGAPAAGKLRTRITVESALYSVDAFGARVPTWTTAYQTWGKVKTTGGAVSESGHVQRGTVTHEVEVRYRANLSVANRLKIGTSTLNIVSCLDPDMKRERLVLSCVEVI